MAKVVKELVTKWTYKVDTRQLVKATQAVVKFKKSILGVRKATVRFGKQERGQIRTMGKGWRRATREVEKYRKAKVMANKADAGGFIGGRGRGVGGGVGGGGGGRRGRPGLFGGGGLFGLAMADRMRDSFRRREDGRRGGFPAFFGRRGVPRQDGDGPDPRRREPARRRFGQRGGIGSAGSSKLSALASLAGFQAVGRFAPLGLGALGAGAAVGIGGAKSVALAGKKEQARQSIGGLLGGGDTGLEQADILLTKLSDFAQKTPFQLGQLRELSSVLLAGGFAANEVVDSLRTMGDVTRGDNDKLNRMLFNFVQIKTVGFANARDLRQFAQAGIPIFEALSKVTGKTGEELEEMTRKRQITLKVIKKAFAQMTGAGGKFFRGMELQSATMFGIFSNVEDSMAVLGEGIGDVFLNDVKAVATAFKSWVDVIKDPMVKRLINIRENVKQIRDIILELDPKLTHIKAAFKGMGVALAAIFITANPMLAAFLAMLLVVDDILNGLRGNKSVTLKLMKGFEEKGVKGIVEAAVEMGTGVDADTIRQQSDMKMAMRAARIRLKKMQNDPNFKPDPAGRRMRAELGTADRPTATLPPPPGTLGPIGKGPITNNNDNKPNITINQTNNGVGEDLADKGKEGILDAADVIVVKASN